MHKSIYVQCNDIYRDYWLVVFVFLLFIFVRRVVQAKRSGRHIPPGHRWGREYGHNLDRSRGFLQESIPTFCTAAVRPDSNKGFGEGMGSFYLLLMGDASPPYGPIVRQPAVPAGISTFRSSNARPLVAILRRCLLRFLLSQEIYSILFDCITHQWGLHY